MVIKQLSQGYKLGKTSVTLTSPNQHRTAFEGCDKPFSYLLANMTASVSTVDCPNVGTLYNCIQILSICFVLCYRVCFVSKFNITYRYRIVMSYYVR